MTFRVSNVNLNTAGTIQVFNNTTSNNIVLRVGTGQHTINSTSIVANVVVANSSGVFKSGSSVNAIPYNVGDVVILSSASPQPANTLICNTAYAKASYPTLSSLAKNPYLDNTTFTDRGNPQALETNLIAVAFGNNTFVAASPSSFFYRSTNGTTWTEQTVAGSQYITDIAYGNGVFVGCGNFDTGGSLYEFRRTTDGITWNNVTAPQDFVPVTIAYGNGFFVTSGFNGSSNTLVYRSTNGTTWTGPTLNILGDPGNVGLNVVYGNGVFLGISNNSTIYRSTDNGGTFSSSTVTGSRILTPFKTAYGNGIFVSVIYGAALDSEDIEAQYIVSTNGLTWNPVSLSSTRKTITRSFTQYNSFSFRELQYLNNLFISTTDFGFEISQNGSDWTFIPSPYRGRGNAAYGNGVYVFPSSESNMVTTKFRTSPLATYDTSTHFKIQAPTNILANQVAYVRFQ